MSEKFIRNFLRGIGLTSRESDVYVFLAKSGTQKGGDVAKSMKMHKAQVYRILHSLENRDMVKILLIVLIGMFIPFVGSIIITFNLDITSTCNLLKIGTSSNSKSETLPFFTSS